MTDHMLHCIPTHNIQRHAFVLPTAELFVGTAWLALYLHFCLYVVNTISATNALCRFKVSSLLSCMRKLLAKSPSKHIWLALMYKQLHHNSGSSCWTAALQSCY